MSEAERADGEAAATVNQLLYAHSPVCDVCKYGLSCPSPGAVLDRRRSSFSFLHQPTSWEGCFATLRREVNGVGTDDLQAMQSQRCHMYARGKMMRCGGCGCLVHEACHDFRDYPCIAEEDNMKCE